MMKKNGFMDLLLAVAGDMINDEMEDIGNDCSPEAMDKREELKELSKMLDEVKEEYNQNTDEDEDDGEDIVKAADIMAMANFVYTAFIIRAIEDGNLNPDNAQEFAESSMRSLVAVNKGIDWNTFILDDDAVDEFIFDAAKTLETLSKVLL